MSSILMFITSSEIKLFNKLHECSKYSDVIHTWSTIMYIHKQRMIFSGYVNFKCCFSLYNFGPAILLNLLQKIAYNIWGFVLNVVAC